MYQDYQIEKPSPEEAQKIREDAKRKAEQKRKDEAKFGVKNRSPYSKAITSYITSRAELDLYTSLHLQESTVTRPCLIRNIDLDLIDAQGEKNIERMRKGNPPIVIINGTENVIHLHHIGQSPASPFAELAVSEHNNIGSSDYLHPSSDISWRHDPKLCTEFAAERSLYWRKRADVSYSPLSHSTPERPVYASVLPNTSVVSEAEHLLCLAMPSQLKTFLLKYGSLSYSDFETFSLSSDDITTSQIINDSVWIHQNIPEALDCVAISDDNIYLYCVNKNNLVYKIDRDERSIFSCDQTLKDFLYKETQGTFTLPVSTSDINKETRELLSILSAYSDEARKKALEAIRFEHFLKTGGFADGIDAFVDSVYEHEWIRRYKAFTSNPLPKIHQTTFCPGGIGHEIVRCGIQNGQQRYQCKDPNCKVNKFFENHSALISNPKNNIPKWYIFVKELISGGTLSECAEAVEISITTAEQWRNRVFYALEYMLDKYQLSGNIQADETYLRLNLKGQEDVKEIANRNSHKRGSSIHPKDLDKQMVCILCAIDSNGYVIARLSGIGYPTSQILMQSVENRIDFSKTEHLVTDGESAMAKLARIKNVPHIPVPPVRYGTASRLYPKTVEVDGKQYNIQRINSLHMRLKRFLSKYNGISSKFLQGYINIFLFHEYYPGNKIELGYTEILRTLCTPGLGGTNEEIANKFVFPKAKAPNPQTLFNYSIDDRWVYYYRQQGDSYESIRKKYGYSQKRITKICKSIDENQLEARVVAWCEHLLAEEMIQKTIQAKKEGINKRNRQILTDYHNGMKQLEIAQKYGISRQRIQQILQEYFESGEAKREKSAVPAKTPSKENLVTRDERLILRYFELRSEYFYGEANELYEVLSKEFGLTAWAIQKRMCKILQRFNFKRRRHKKLSQEEIDNLFLEFCREYDKKPNRSIRKINQIIAGRHKLNTNTIYIHLWDREKEYTQTKESNN